MSNTDSFIERVKKKQRIATKIFQKMYTEEEQKQKEKILNEVLEQIEVCEGLCRPVTENEIREWLNSDNVIQMSRKVRNHKFPT